MKVIERFLHKALQQRVLDDPAFAQRLRDRAQEEAPPPDPAAVETTRQATESVFKQALDPSPGADLPDAFRQLLRERATQQGDK